MESGDRFGGVICTEHIDDCVLEAGPDSFLSEKPRAADLCRELGLGDQLIGSNDAERVTYMLIKRRLVPIPDGLMFMVPTKLAPTFFSPLFSWSTKLRILREWFHRAKLADSECTVADFVERHYGREMVERVADPLLAGVYGGSADELSVQSVLPRFLDMEAKFGSLGRAMVAARKVMPSQPKPLFTSLRGGMQQMVDALLAKVPETARRCGVKIESVRQEHGKWLVVDSGKRTEEFDAAILAVPAYAAASLLQSSNENLAGELNAISYSSSVTVVLGYGPEVRAALPPGFGFLVPRSEGRRMLAATFVHNKFPHRAPTDRALIRCFLGGSRDEQVISLSDNEIVAVTRRELKEILGISAEPIFARVHKWSKSMAQYTVGHSARVARIREMLRPGLALAGNAYGGIGVPDCVRSGTEAAGKVLQDLGVPSPSALSS
jgi:oxygen-dependent protoporphyrinogen oxidase